MPRRPRTDIDLPTCCGAIAVETAHLSANGPRWISLVSLAKGMRIDRRRVVDLAIEARDLGLITIVDSHSVCLTAKGQGAGIA